MWYQNSLHWKKVSHHWCLGELKEEFCDLASSLRWGSICTCSMSITTSNVVMSWSVRTRSTRQEFLMCSSNCYIWWTQMECTKLFLVFWIQCVLAVLLNIWSTDPLWKQHKVTTITSLDLIPKKGLLCIQTGFKKPKYIFFISASLSSSMVNCSLTPLLSKV